MQTALTGEACRSVRENSILHRFNPVISEHHIYTLPFSLKPDCKVNVLYHIALRLAVKQLVHMHTSIHKSTHPHTHPYTYIPAEPELHGLPSHATVAAVAQTLSQGPKQEPNLLCIVGLSGEHMCQVNRHRYEKRTGEERRSEGKCQFTCKAQYCTLSSRSLVSAWQTTNIHNC